MRRAVAELYASVLIVGIVVALSYFVFTQAAVPRHASRPIIVTKRYVIYGDPSLFFLQLNASGEVTIDEFRVDSASSLTGVLSLGQNGYGVASGLCAPGLTTFFSVFSPTEGSLTVNTNGESWVDGSSTHSAIVSSGWHELIIVNGSNCTITLPGGASVNALSKSVSMIPIVRSLNSTRFESYIPFATSSHSVSLVSEAGVETVGF